jgi:sirohydrochlorin ferrochelatase
MCRGVDGDGGVDRGFDMNGGGGLGVGGDGGLGSGGGGGFDMSGGGGFGAVGVPLLAVAHGTRDAAGMAEIAALLARVQALRPGLRAVLGCVDVARPSLAGALAGLRGPVAVVPLLLGTGYHVRVDLPRALAAAPWVAPRRARVLGPDPLLAEALAGRLGESGGGWDAVVLAAAGSTDPAAHAEAAAMAGLLAARLGVPVVAAALCGGQPRPAEAVAALRAGGHRRVAVARYLMAPGHFARLAAAAGGSVTSAPLGAHEAVARLVLRRYDEACTGGEPGSKSGSEPGSEPVSEAVSTGAAGGRR